MPETGPHSIQLAEPRSTEGPRVGKTQAGAQKVRGRGRPPGSKNKAKSLLPPEIATEILLRMKDILPPDHYEYMRGVIKDGKQISTKTELDALILLLSRNLYPALVMEQISTVETGGESGDDFFDDPDLPEAERPTSPKESKLKMPVFRKDVTERLKVLQGLLSLRNQVEKRDSDSDTDEKPLLKIIGGRGLNSDRVRIILGIESGTVVRDPDRVGGSDEAGALPDKLPERPKLLPTGEQGEADRILDNYSSGGIARRRDES